MKLFKVKIQRILEFEAKDVESAVAQAIAITAEDIENSYWTEVFDYDVKELKN